jgi:hypothetical protein
MADIARRGSRPQFVVPVTFALVVILAAACSTAAVSPSPSPAPTPVPSVDPHLGDPASAKSVFNGLGREGLKLVTNTAVVGAAGTAVITRINATYGGWPLQLVEYRTAADLKKAAVWKAGQAPGKGEPPVALAGANILIRWGPWDRDTKPPRPDERQTAALEALVAAMDRLLAPLRTRSNVPVQTVSVPVAAEDGPSAAPEATPAP